MADLSPLDSCVCGHERHAHCNACMDCDCNKFRHEAWCRTARVDSLGIGDFIEREDYGDDGLYGEIVKVSGPFTDTGEGHQWFTFRVQRDNRNYEGNPRPPVTVGPMRADRLVKCWS